jgi:hypothetical protein
MRRIIAYAARGAAVEPETPLQLIRNEVAGDVRIFRES